MSPTTDNNDKPTTTEAVERTPDEVEKKKPTTWTGPRKRWVPIVVLLFVFDWRLGVACLIPLVAAFATMGYMMNPRMNNFQ